MVAHLSEVAGQLFDYVIIGAGTSGLTVAGRLAEDPEISVAVLEAGEALLDDPKILLGGGFGSTWGNPKYDWAFTTVPQTHENDRTIPGGSSGMNFYGWIKPPAQDVDVFEELGNPGWNWESYQRCTKRCENFTPANESQLKAYPHTFGEDSHGKGGPLQTTVALMTYITDKLFLDAFSAQGVKFNEDPYGGNINGTWMSASSLDRSKKWTRSYSATAYYLPHKDNPKFKVLTEAFASRVIFADESVGNDLVAIGVEFIHGGKTHFVRAKEVIISAGTIKTPQILELSGIGGPDILKRIGVPLKIDLPGVGENVQDHLLFSISYELDQSLPHETFDGFRDPEFAKEQARLQELDEDNRHRYGISAYAYLPLAEILPEFADSFAKRVGAWIEEQKKDGKLNPGLEEQLDIQLRILKDKDVPDVEFVSFPGYMSFPTLPENKNHISLISFLQHPLSRGTIHAKSNNPLEQPAIDPHYFANGFDLELTVEQMKYMKNVIATTDSFKSGIVREIDPGPATLTDEQIRDYVKKTCGSGLHAVGSASMLPREKNGVVDPELKVYGTTNVRVADLSIIPLQLAGHTQATAYYVGERLAEILQVPR
ncbi:hypothetical protein NLI96_g9296 [Meripilus lineatus]|uniref:Glucose-methanol-choline oxidoreductase N-terminal domain-containing protein n=1 Tax=Meripilus lineatus TaxID=2056292 RepID=A0AAD5YFC7_9APHY|nr:hypothetical protein NLI96_g9296 [Physisporinus lineatus]